MKNISFKNEINSLLGALAMTITGMLINILCCKVFGIAPPLAISTAGGDCIEHIGFGLNILELFPTEMLPGADASAMTSRYEIVSFNLLSFLITVLCFFIIIVLIKKVVKK